MSTACKLLLLTAYHACFLSNLPHPFSGYTFYCVQQTREHGWLTMLFVQHSVADDQAPHVSYMQGRCGAVTRSRISLGFSGCLRRRQ